MTATLPTFIQKQIASVLNVNHIVKPSQTILKQLSRHKLFLQGGSIENQSDFITQKLRDGYKVLIVCNTVDKAQQLYQTFSEQFHKEDIILLHSRFTMNDRIKIEQKILSEQKPSLLIGTQAIEVSLDIDYDLIVTEPAPLDALLQRFGRVYRKRRLNKEDKPNCYVTTTIEEVFTKIYRDEKEDKIISKTLIELE